MTIITAVTVTRNASLLIGRTVSSVASQSAVTSGRVELQYLLRDGASTDDTVERATVAAGRTSLTVVSEPDQGMYDALAQGLQAATGDIVFYLNAGDVLYPGALDVVLDVMAQSGARWLTGYDAIVNAAGVTVSVKTPFRYRPRLMRAGEYGRRLPFLQQESTFWCRELMHAVDLEALRAYRLAGDQYLWRCFSTVEEVTVVRALLGGFTLHGSHLSDDLASYSAEVKRVQGAGILTPFYVVFDRLLWLAPDRVKKRANGQHFLVYDEAADRWR